MTLQRVPSLIHSTLWVMDLEQVIDIHFLVDRSTV